MIKNVLIDLDDTIFDFHKAEAVALNDTLRELGIEPTPEMTKRYSEINASQWKLLELGLTDRNTMLTERFTLFFNEIKSDASGADARRIYEYRLGSCHFFIDGAEDLLSDLYQKYDLYLASNGTDSVQTRRIAASGIEKYFKDIFISERIGADKPSKKYFDICFSKIKGFRYDETIIIGDSISSDIKGGINAGIHTCLYDPHKKYTENDAEYRVTDLREISALLERI